MRSHVVASNGRVCAQVDAKACAEDGKRVWQEKEADCQVIERDAQDEFVRTRGSILCFPEYF